MRSDIGKLVMFLEGRILEELGTFFFLLTEFGNSLYEEIQVSDVVKI